MKELDKVRTLSQAKAKVSDHLEFSAKTGLKGVLRLIGDCGGAARAHPGLQVVKDASKSKSHK